MSGSRKNVGWLFLLPAASIGWWVLGYPPGWDWLFFLVIPTMGVSAGALVTLGGVVFGLHGGLIRLRANL